MHAFIISNILNLTSRRVTITAICCCERIWDTWCPHQMRFGENNIEILNTHSFLISKVVSSWNTPRRWVELSQLPATISTITVKMSTISQTKSVSFTARYSYYLFVSKSFNLHWVRLIRFIIRILWQISYVIKTKLSESSLSPSKNMSFFW